jgi:DNA repair protein RadA/Sms
MLAAITRDSLGLYATGEESTAQVAMRAHRVGAALPGIKLVRETDLDGILWHARREQARIVVIDSIHTLRSSEAAGMPGSDYQIKVCGHILMEFAKDTGISVVVISHVNKDGEINGPMNLEHAGDETLMLDKNRELGEPWRELRALKNRFGSTTEVGMFEMSDTGLLPVSNGAVPERGDDNQDEILPVAQELLHRYLELGGTVDGDLRDRISGRLDLTPRGSR